MTERALLMGWKAIADYVGYSERGLRNHRRMLLDTGVVFYRRMALGKRMVCAWRADLRAWTKAPRPEAPVGMRHPEHSGDDPGLAGRQVA